MPDLILPKLTQSVPKGYVGCIACVGKGKFGQETCAICKGKGYWNADDINDYHKRFPEVCRISCGKKHIVPNMNVM